MYPLITIWDTKIYIFWVFLLISWIIFFYLLHFFGQKKWIVKLVFTDIFSFTGQSGFLDFWKDFLINDNYNLSLAGGIIGFSVVFFYKIYKRKQQGQLAKYIDIIIPSFLISGVIWYIGALFGGQVYGTPSTAFFAINYNTKNSLIPGTLFPLPIFYVIGILVLLFVMYKINKKPNIPEGYTGLLLMGLFGVLLFFGEFFSGSPDMFEVFIRINQLIGIIFIVAALIWIIKFFRS